jgi:hypothetical protein
MFVEESDHLRALASCAIQESRFIPEKAVSDGILNVCIGPVLEKEFDNVQAISIFEG